MLQKNTHLLQRDVVRRLLEVPDLDLARRVCGGAPLPVGRDTRDAARLLVPSPNEPFARVVEVPHHNVALVAVHRELSVWCHVEACWGSPLRDWRRRAEENLGGAHCEKGRRESARDSSLQRREERSGDVSVVTTSGHVRRGRTSVFYF